MNTPSPSDLDGKIFLAEFVYFAKFAPYYITL